MKVSVFYAQKRRIEFFGGGSLDLRNPHGILWMGCFLAGRPK